VILQIDLPFAARTPNQQPETIDAYGTKGLSADPDTTVYIDAGAYGRLSPAQQGTLLISKRDPSRAEVLRERHAVRPYEPGARLRRATSTATCRHRSRGTSTVGPSTLGSR
jgi:hypothetical protein